MACQFSAPFQFGSKNVCYSPSATLLASASGSSLTIRDAVSLEIIDTHTCIDKIEKIEFSPDSSYILCGIFARCAIQVYSLADSKWRCRINESVAGVISASWSPDSRHIVVESDFGIQLAVWSLVDNVSYIINSPKIGKSIFSFSDCGRYFAVGHRFECKDHIGVYSTSPWAELNKFRTRSTDMVGLQWTPAGTHIVVQDSHLSYRVLVYTPAGEILTQFEAYQNALGVRSVAFHRLSEEMTTPQEEPAPCPSPLLAIGSFDGQIRLLSTHSWKLAFVLPLTHPADMLELMSNGVVTTVEVVDTGATDTSEVDLDTMSVSDLSLSFSAKRNKAQAGQLGSAYITRPLKNLPKLSPSSQQPKNDMLLPKFGVSWIGWSACGNLLGARDDSHPRCLWIWNALEARLCDLLVQLDSIVCARWRPDTNMEEESPQSLPVLAFCCNTPRVYFWTPNGSSWADLPASTETVRTTTPARPSRLTGASASAVAQQKAAQNLDGIVQLNVVGLKWSSDGLRLIIIGKERFCTCEVSFSEDGEPDISLVEA